MGVSYGTLPTRYPMPTSGWLTKAPPNNGLGIAGQTERGTGGREGPRESWEEGFRREHGAGAPPFLGQIATECHGAGHGETERAALSIDNYVTGLLSCPSYSQRPKQLVAFGSWSTFSRKPVVLSSRVQGPSPALGGQLGGRRAGGPSSSAATAETASTNSAAQEAHLMGWGLGQGTVDVGTNCTIKRPS